MLRQDESAIEKLFILFQYWKFRNYKKCFNEQKWAFKISSINNQDESLKKMPNFERIEINHPNPCIEQLRKPKVGRELNYHQTTFHLLPICASTAATAADPGCLLLISNPTNGILKFQRSNCTPSSGTFSYTFRPSLVWFFPFSPLQIASFAQLPYNLSDGSTCTQFVLLLFHDLSFSHKPISWLGQGETHIKKSERKNSQQLAQVSSCTHNTPRQPPLHTLQPTCSTDKRK